MADNARIILISFKLLLDITLLVGYTKFVLLRVDESQ